MAKVNLVALIAFILLCQLAGFIGSAFTIPSLQGWYLSLNKPSFTPPEWVFLPVWLVLYTMMGVAAYLVWEKGYAMQARLKDGWQNEKMRPAEWALGVFGIQLVENILWCYVFFSLHSLLYGLMVMAFLWVSIVLTMACFYVINRKAAYLLVPYLLWVSFAMVLNYEIWLLNP